ncbi:murein biosynthesis integral membrane protein MurJ [Planktothrix sp. FACHB-1355]|uniref:Murein biosynthesis integral membrane protein MurJ n=1 Tax=Aerosakkonema funiforme FACHB-1375 TaxID=2949571 RepID=A0A926VJD2_9CYAN|nr:MULTISPECIES: murein biosynthesis integral membrane protein MurJ [Oscillatoriales]MBD2184939.1 murein biosynthesis integral membrane protein MurJ [Aerosakkonema funiforme FACHB-1375]MBD3561567.1 murein biosynthesis integral membrane protein MurJ [Planktothrix sp. FACHB-1355]
MKNGLYQKSLTFWNKLSSGSTNRKILAATLIVGVGLGFAKLISTFKELVVAWNFGTSDSLDAFLMAFVLPSFITNVVAGSFNAALIPTYIQVREKEGKEAAQKLFSGAIVWSCGLLAITTLIMLASAPFLLPKIASGFHPEKLDLTYKLLWALAPSIIFSGILTVWAAVLNAGERFALAAVAETLTPAMTILFMLLFHSWDVFSLACGLVAGQLLEMIVIGMALHKQQISLIPKWYGFDENLRQVIGQYAPMIAGAFLMSSCSLVDQSMAAMLAPGSVAALLYGKRLVLLPITIASTALSTAVIPYFSKMIAHQDWKSVEHTLGHYLRLIFGVTVPMTVLFIAVSEPLIHLLFQRGSFHASDTSLVSAIQICYALQIPFYIANILVVRLVSAMKMNHLLMQVSALNLVVNIACNYLFMEWMGIKGIALSTSVVYMFCFSFMLINGEIHLRKQKKLSKEINQQ